ncbi:FAD-dependent monooxygenase [Georgenia sp. Z1344]|uniref:FAD binding domain-containing protein n=1 Tax=Georgenia sp. Z1344 TaxID=3416706 RepID=UPI003CE80960
MTVHQGRRAVVVGGSIGGLTAALLLRDLGFEVTVLERSSSQLDGRGGGIVLQPEMLRWFRERSRLTPDDVSTRTEWLRFLGTTNDLLHEERIDWSYSSWTTLYRALLSDFGTDGYLLGEVVVGFSQDDDVAEVRCASGRILHAEFVVFADGISSVGRRRINGEVEMEYAGYVGWRGTVPEHELSAGTLDLLGDALSYSLAPQTHICMYPIPGPTSESRLMNYVWYRNVPAGPELDEMMMSSTGSRGGVSVPQGLVQQRYVDEMREAAAVLAPAATELVRATAEPYIQRVVDVRSPRMAEGRVVVIGDAAFAARPHAAAGTAKAAEDGWSLAEALSGTEDVTGVLAGWEQERLTVGNQLVDRVAWMGDVVQRDSSWDPGDPAMRFGLHGPREVASGETALPVR